MGTKTKVYTEEQLERKTHFSLVVSDREILKYYIVDIAEAENYLRLAERKVLIISDNPENYKKGMELAEIKYQFLMNFSVPSIKICRIDDDTITNPKVFEIVLERFKHGLIILDLKGIKHNEEHLRYLYSQLACFKKKNGIDFLVHKNTLAEITQEEAERSTLLRLHYDESFKLSFERLIALNERFGDKSLGVALAQYIVNEQKNRLDLYYNEIKEEKGEDFEKLLDKRQLSEYQAYFLYYDLCANKILNISVDLFVEGCEKFMRTINKTDYDIEELKRTYLIA